MTTILREVPLPLMPEVAPLWAACIHTKSAVRIITKPDRKSADEYASGVNGWLEAVSKRDDFDAKVDAGLITWTGAEVIEWPYSPDEHAEDLARQKREEDE